MKGAAEASIPKWCD